MLLLACETRLGAREIDVYAELENWARWCNRVGECYPRTPTNWQMMEQVEYKNCHQTIEEKIQEALEHQEPNELQAMRVERIIANMLNVPLRVVIRLHYVTMPEHKRHDMGLTLEQWDERRARHATRRASWYFSPDMYLEAVRRAVDEIEAAL